MVSISVAELQCDRSLADVAAVDNLAADLVLDEDLVITVGLNRGERRAESRVDGSVFVGDWRNRLRIPDIMIAMASLLVPRIMGPRAT